MALSGRAGSLTSRIRAARRAIGDEARTLIRTLHRVGHIFDAEVTATTRRIVAVPQSELRFLVHRGRSIAWTSSGDGPPLVIPAWWVSNVSEELSIPRIADFYARLGAGCRLIRYDRPGSGMSDREARSGGLDDDKDLLGAVMDAAEVESAHLFAMSMGGPVAVRFAAEFRQRVCRLCLYGTATAGSEMAPPEVQKAMVGLVPSSWGIASRALSDIFMPFADGEGLERSARLKRISATSDAAADILEMAYALSAGDAPASVTAETIVLHRKGDRAVPIAAARRLAAKIPAPASTSCPAMHTCRGKKTGKSPIRRTAFSSPAAIPDNGVTRTATVLVRMLGSTARSFLSTAAPAAEVARRRL